MRLLHQFFWAVGRINMSLTSIWSGAVRHQTTASAMSWGCKHFSWEYRPLAVSLFPKDATSKNSVSTTPGDMQVTRKGISRDRACKISGLLAQLLQLEKPSLHYYSSR